MAYSIGQEIFNISGVCEVEATHSVSERMTLRVYFGASIRDQGSAPWIQADFYVQDMNQPIASSRSHTATESIEVSAALEMLPGTSYKMKVQQHNERAACRSTWMRGVIVAV